MIVSVADDEAAYGETLHKNGAHELRLCIARRLRRSLVVLRDEPADRNARVRVQQGNHGSKYLAADVFEVDVDAAGAGGRELRVECRGAMVDAVVEPELVHGPGALVRTAGNADDPTTLQFGDLTHDRTHGSGGRGDHQRLA